MLERHPRYKESIDTMLDCFGGADGGGSFVKLCNLIERFADEHDEGDEAAGEILTLVLRFEQLIKVAKIRASR